jgi:PIN domain nuclease of toxin-antitoxin system
VGGVRAGVGLLLDTCVLLDLAHGASLRPEAVAALVAARRADQAFVSAVAALEVAQKSWAGKLRLDRHPADWFREAVDELELIEMTISSAIALEAYALPEPFDRDPADRLVVATGRLLAVPVLTSDRNIIAYAAAGHVDVLPY